MEAAELRRVWGEIQVEQTRAEQPRPPQASWRELFYLKCCVSNFYIYCYLHYDEQVYAMPSKIAPVKLEKIDLKFYISSCSHADQISIARTYLNGNCVHMKEKFNHFT